MSNRASRVLNCLLDASVVTVDPGFVIESRTAYGVHGEKDDLALSVEWRDDEGCLWAADFSEAALAQAELRKGTISLCDTNMVKFSFQLYQPTKHITFSSH